MYSKLAAELVKLETSPRRPGSTCWRSGRGSVLNRGRITRPSTGLRISYHRPDPRFILVRADTTHMLLERQVAELEGGSLEFRAVISRVTSCADPSGIWQEAHTTCRLAGARGSS